FPPVLRFAEVLFSGRRRRSRLSRDWSSDVCSSALPDFHKIDPDTPSKEPLDSAAALRSLYEPEVLDAKIGVAEVVLQTLPPGGEIGRASCRERRRRSVGARSGGDKEMDQYGYGHGT